MLLKSTCFLCQCISFMCIVICFATLMSFNSRNTVNTPCMDYITINRMIITPIYGWTISLLLRSASRGMMTIPLCDYSWYDFIPFLAWPCSTYFGMKFIPLLLLSSFRKYIGLCIIGASVVWMHKKAATVLPNILSLAAKTISKQPAFQSRGYGNLQQPITT